MSKQKVVPGFLQGGGEMGKLMREFDWSATSLGSPESWPLSLRTTIGIILHSAFPKFLFWGEDLLCFYNDAYRPSLGKEGKHPLIGKKGKEAWPEIWHFIGPLIEQVMSTGEPAWFEDQLLPIYRNGKLEDVYWTFSYSAAFGDDGNINGVFVTCTETTEKVVSTQRIEKSQEELLTYFEQSPVAIATISKDNLTFRLVNTFYAELVGRTPEELIDKPLLEALPEIAGQGFDKLLEQVIETGVPYSSTAVPVLLRRKGIMETIYVDLVYQPQHDHNRKIKGALVVATDVTQQVRTERQLTESRQRLLFAIDATELGTWELNPATNKFTGNDRLKKWFGLKPEDEIDLTNATNVILEEDRERVIEAISHALKPESGGRYTIEYTIRNPHTGKHTIVKAKGQTHFDETGKPIVFAGTLQDITFEASIAKQLAIEVAEQKRIRKEIEDSEAMLALTRNAVPSMIFYMDAEQRYRSYNNVFMEWFSVNESDAIGKTTREFIGEKAYENVRPRLEKAYAGERVSFEMYAPSRMNADRWLNIVYTPHVLPNGSVQGVIVHATDISQSKRTEFSLRESEAKFKELIQAAPAGIGVFVGRDLIIENPNQTFIDIVGKGPNIVGLPLREAMPELITEGQAFLKILDDVYTTGVPFISPASLVKIVQNGVLNDNYYNISYTPLRNSKGEVYAILDIAIDVTEHVRAKNKIEEAEVKLRNAVDIAGLGTWTYDVITGVADISEQYAAMLGLSNGNDSFTEAVKGIADQDRDRVLTTFKQAMEPGSSGKYEAEYRIINARTGVEQIIHAVGQTYFENGVALRISGIARDITSQREVQLELENQVTLRTRELKEKNEEQAVLNIELKRSNAELEQFAYIASHDLQEPIRKISTFTQMLEQNVGMLSEKGKGYISKIYNSTDRMTKLIRDVLAYSQVNNESGDFEQVDLNIVLQTIQNDFEVQIENTGATIHLSGMPTLEAIPIQMTQLFGNLISNSLKYRKTDVPPVIQINCGVATAEKISKRMSLDPNKKYYHIQISDNGIGFHPDHVDRIFKIFQRLHGKQEFEGTGIGLAICLKIVQKHHGHIAAAVGENGGAIFNILLPENQATQNA